jgi:SAM-dependent methyltransferase
VPKRYDRAYFDKWYRGHDRITTAAELRRKVTLAVAETEYFLRRTLRSVLDVACGEGAWFPHVKALRPRASYRGIDPSDYAVAAFGRQRRIEKGSLGDVARIRGTFDLVVCADALHYIDDDEIAVALPHLASAAGGVLWLEALTREDSIIGDMEGLIRRPAAWYRQSFAAAGLTQIGTYMWLAPPLRDDPAALERCTS